jgi:hypothetical protein
VRSFINLGDAISNEDAQVSNLTNSIEGLTKGLAQSTSRIDGLSGQLETHRNEMDQFAARLHTIEVSLRSRQLSKAPATEVTPAPIIPRSSLGSPLLPNPHTHSVDLSIPLPAGFVAHRNAEREVDYWIGPRVGDFGENSVRILPFEANLLGVIVHDIDDGKDYLLTKQGGWTEIPAQH